MSASTAAVPAVENERPRRLIKLPEVMIRTALSRSETYRRVRSDTDFPKPTALGVRSVAWVEAEIDAYICSRIEKRDSKARLA